MVALDNAGRQSGPSDVAELRHPLIATGALPLGRPGSYYEAQIEFSASIGHLVSQDEDGKAYQMRYRGGDELAFSLGGAPEALSIGRKTGLISGYLPANSAGRYTLTVSVTDQRTGASDSKTYEFEVKDTVPVGLK
ncbi:MAG: hypothetical protein A3F83_10300 [Candidatus Glassbacteria bacterium RIFCSPLOWO2_12_FULL_58_11]|uniref:Uncharacterized protein n=1 Tax=Candidatus Glassbacteria bacterium RIFCSPLOWO2_12_FULL_58_11 TaxID=1817867 RepID=A0A1F5YYY3_9BACT|nr:MAG: hypothetical protein A3F83_10300 [Candidatus Glassbacteria bacterium RIFCSPLOWO2_12_FULL_58_11]